MTGDDAEGLEVRYVQAYEATKAYECPGCNHEIPAGTHHVVVVPVETPDLRRHWHRPCWERRLPAPPVRTRPRSPRRRRG